jgi:hypothetical protein
VKQRIGVAVALGAAGLAQVVSAAPVLRRAEADVVFRSSTACTVELAVEVEGATEVEHRVELPRGGRVELLEVRGAVRRGEPHDVGRTRALILQPGSASYALRYTVEHPPDRPGRCPLWIPTVPTDGRSQAVSIRVRVPDGAEPVGTMPAFTWSGGEGRTVLGHLPAFVHVPYALAGEPAPWNVAAVMDVAAVATLLAATAAWFRRRIVTGTGTVTRGQAP